MQRRRARTDPDGDYRLDDYFSWIHRSEKVIEPSTGESTCTSSFTGGVDAVCSAPASTSASSCSGNRQMRPWASGVTSIAVDPCTVTRGTGETGVLWRRRHPAHASSEFAGESGGGLTVRQGLLPVAIHFSDLLTGQSVLAACGGPDYFDPGRPARVDTVDISEVAVNLPAKKAIVRWTACPAIPCATWKCSRRCRKKSWDKIVTKMIKSFGAPVKDSLDAGRIVDYLVAMKMRNRREMGIVNQERNGTGNRNKNRPLCGPFLLYGIFLSEHSAGAGEIAFPVFVFKAGDHDAMRGGQRARKKLFIR